MAELTPEALPQQVRMAKFRDWTADPTKAPLIPPLVQALNCTEIRKQKSALTALSARTQEDKGEVLLQLRTLSSSHSQDVSRFQKRVDGIVKKNNATTQKVAEIAAKCSAIATKMNTLQNAHSGLEARLTARLAEIEGRLDSLETDESRRENEELASLLKSYKELIGRIGQISHAELASFAESLPQTNTGKLGENPSQRSF